MNQKELTQKVAAKLRVKPHTKNIDQSYVEDTVSDAVNDALDYINYCDGDINEKMVTPITDLCVYRLILTGNEGLTSSSKAGTSETYSGDIPKSIRRVLRKHRDLP